MTKFTGNRWHVAGQSEESRYITIKADTGRTVARVPWCPENPEGHDLESDHYDALLIAAAPQMTERLRKVNQLLVEMIQNEVFCEGDGDYYETVQIMINDNERVINEATK